MAHSLLRGASPAPSDSAAPVDGVHTVNAGDDAALRAERDGLRAAVRRHEGTLAAQVATIERLQGRSATTEQPIAPTAPDVAEGAAVLGRPVRLNDLTLVIGIDAEVNSLLRARDIVSWWDLATAPIGSLRTMLDAARPALRALDPSSWPTQARLLAHGNWQQFKNITDRL
ncbi:MAG: hypothetical protein F2789_08495 [Actinobacteria bacterium]|nr:hypothetical protein [Actinomycetota bacterium]